MKQLSILMVCLLTVSLSYCQGTSQKSVRCLDDSDAWVINRVFAERDWLRTNDSLQKVEITQCDSQLTATGNIAFLRQAILNEKDSIIGDFEDKEVLNKQEIAILRHGLRTTKFRQYWQKPLICIGAGAVGGVAGYLVAKFH